MHFASPSDKLKSGKRPSLAFHAVVYLTHINSLSLSIQIRFQNRRMKLKKEIQAIKELNEQEKQAQAQKAALAAQGHSIEGN